MFPRVNGNYDIIAFVRSRDPGRLGRFCLETSRIELPVREILILGRDYNPRLAGEITKELARNRRPSLLMAEGVDLGTREQLAIIFYPRGMYPGEALATIKKAAKEKHRQITAQSN